MDEFNQAVKLVKSFPDLYEIIDGNLRRCLLNRLPYGLIYGVDKATVVIVAVAHLKRKPNYWEAIV